jgi:hypothetical protein
VVAKLTVPRELVWMLLEGPKVVTVTSKGVPEVAIGAAGISKSRQEPGSPQSRVGAGDFACHVSAWSAGPRSTSDYPFYLA